MSHRNNKEQLEKVRVQHAIIIDPFFKSPLTSTTLGSHRWHEGWQKRVEDLTL